MKIKNPYNTPKSHKALKSTTKCSIKASLPQMVHKYLDGGGQRKQTDNDNNNNK